MPIDIEEFESADSNDLVSTDQPCDRSVLDFLAFNTDRAYTQGEIHSELDLTRFEIATALSDLKGDDLVRQKGSYWIVTDEGVEVNRK